jgi:hypothetical protein
MSVPRRVVPIRHLRAIRTKAEHDHTDKKQMRQRDTDELELSAREQTVDDLLPCEYSIVR